MKKTLIGGLVLVLVAFGFFGCDGLLEMNLFANLESPPKTAADIAASADTATLIADLTKAIQYQSFYTDLAADPDSKAAIIAALTNLFGAAEPAITQKAALLVVEIEINTTEAKSVRSDALVVAGEMVTLLTADDSSGVDTTALATSVMDMFAGLTDIQAAAASFENSAAAYEAYVDSMYDAENDTYVFPEGADVMQIASTALLCALVEASGGAEAFAEKVEAGTLTVDASTLESVAWAGNLFEALGSYFGGGE